MIIVFDERKPNDGVPGRSDEGWVGWQTLRRQWQES